MEIEYVSVSKILPAYFNPKSRAKSQRSVSGLLESLKKHGMLNPVQLSEMQDGTYLTDDGHRRVYCARILGMADVPAIVNRQQKNAEERFEALNTHRPLISDDWLEIYLDTDGAVNPPAKTLGHIRYVLEIMGRAGLELLRSSSTSPTIAGTVKSVVAKFNETAYLREGAPTPSQILTWMIRRKTHFFVKNNLSRFSKKNLETMKRRILSDKEFSLADV